MKDKFEEIEIDKIDEDVANHRLVTDAASDTQLLQSILDNGVQQPVKVLRKADGRYTLVFGFRRTAMSKKAGLKTIPANVVTGLSPGDIRALQAIENLERKELHPMEEAEFCLDLVETLADTGTDYVAEEVAKRIGRTPKWVELRLALARLSPRVKQAFLEGDIYLQHAHLIARLAGHDAQEEVLGQVKANTPTWAVTGTKRHENKRPPSTIAETRRLVEQRLRDLTGVPWKLDAVFDAKPACSECIHNTANRFDLFDGDQPKKPQCLNAECFKEKNIFASRAVQRATNTLVKMEGDVTPANARKAIEEREVEFVQTKAVTAAAKRRAQPTEVSTSEKRGSAKADRAEQIRSAVAARLQEWREKADKRITELLPIKDPMSLAAMYVVRQSMLLSRAEWGHQPKAKKLARAKLDKLLPLLLGAPEPGESVPEVFLEDLRQIIGLLGSELVEEAKKDLTWDHPLFGDDAGDYVIEKFAAHLKLENDIGAMPTYAAVEAELFPDSADEKPAKKKRVVKKARGKQKATTA